MNATEENNKKLNRRIAIRIYERANLFYHKIDRSPSIDTQSGFDQILTGVTPPQTAEHAHVEQSLPTSQSQENDTLNVNISSSGIAFTGKEELKAGDYLMLRILLLSSMTVVTTCCKVVYCKPSNPYENDRYPFSIGARFINITAEDTALLDRYVTARKKQQWLINGLIVALITTILAAPALVFGLLAGLSHHLLEIAIHLLHLGFEYLELGLDHVIEHLFHTDRHATQVIVFYVLIALGLTVLYHFGRKIPLAWARFSKYLMLFWSRKKSSCLYFWAQQSLLDKCKIIGISTTALVAYIYFAI